MNQTSIPQDEDVMISVSFTKEELEQLIHEASNRACQYAYSGAPGVGPWQIIREKLISAIRDR